jgi:hypothetical protein
MLVAVKGPSRTSRRQPRHSAGPVPSLVRALLVRFVPTVAVFAGCVLLGAVLPDRDAPNAVRLWTPVVGLVAGALVGWGYEAANAAKRSGIVRSVGASLGAGGALAYFGVTGMFANWGATFGIAFFVMASACALVVVLHRRRHLDLPLPRRDAGRTTFYGPDASSGPGEAV